MLHPPDPPVAIQGQPEGVVDGPTVAQPGVARGPFGEDLRTLVPDGGVGHAQGVEDRGSGDGDAPVQVGQAYQRRPRDPGCALISSSLWPDRHDAVAVCPNVARMDIGSANLHLSPLGVDIWLDL